MLLIAFTVVVYVFFVYGLMEFTKKVYSDIIISNKMDESLKIQVLVNDIEDLEYTIRSLRKHFTHIVILLNDDIGKVPKTLEDIAKGINIEYRRIGEDIKAREF